jgi:hypothetical protein
MSHDQPTADDTTFNAHYVEIVSLGEHSITDALGELARDSRLAASHQRNHGQEALAAIAQARADAYQHALSLVDLAFEQAMARVARQAVA